MLGTDDSSITRRAVVERARESAARQALRQGRLNATVSMIGALAAADGAGPDDYRRFFMAWQATRVLRPLPTMFLLAPALSDPSRHVTAGTAERKAPHEGQEAPAVDQRRRQVDNGGLR